MYVKAYPNSPSLKFTTLMSPNEGETAVCGSLMNFSLLYVSDSRFSHMLVLLGIKYPIKLQNIKKQLMHC